VVGLQKVSVILVNTLHAALVNYMHRRSCFVVPLGHYRAVTQNSNGGNVKIMFIIREPKTRATDPDQWHCF
jgi:hypothetical protein